ncbi:MAG: CRISPR-associated endonuclease Cas3'' [Spirochaetales bacterium]|nr:CRISPR-associated endonuclease Cas3'' [Spirochaetales bacterium]
MREHLESVAALAKSFADKWGNGDWGWLAGLWHDLGKYKPAFQNYIRESGDYEKLELADGHTGKEHAIVGALHALQKAGEEGYLFGRVLAYLIAGHHTGLPDWNHEMGIGGALEPKLREFDHLDDALRGKPPSDLLEATLPETLCQTTEPQKNLHLWIRMIFSCLVDADFLDTERYKNATLYRARAIEIPTMIQLRDRFDRFITEKQSSAVESPVNQLRSEVLGQCRAHAVWTPGIFSLTVPTGGGKTLSGMAFALDHAIKYNKRRVVVAIPYTSIIEQTAKEYRNVFGANVVLEHHSNVDPSCETEQAKLASENWDAPIIVTTNVQLFESLFAARTSACRKLHNLADSVIILDEAQMLPPEFLDPIVSSIKGLVEMFGCSVVLSTATQPSLTGEFQSGKAVFQGFAKAAVRELMSDPQGLARRLSRVEIQRLESSSDRVTWHEVAEHLCAEEQVLCIVNTRRDCRELFELMPQGTIHLSALMCPEHRSVVIDNIKQKLKVGQSLRVISTQLVEAGVNIDFPVVYRAMAGFDSIAQAAGRCNREGQLNNQGTLGRTVVFMPPNDAPPGLLRWGQIAGEETLKLHPDLAARLDPEVFEYYFAAFYRQQHSFDTKGIMSLLGGRDAIHAQIQFRTAAARFNLIDDSAQVSVVVHYDNGRTLVNEVEHTGPYRDLMHRIQRFTVTIPKRAAQVLTEEGFLRPVVNLDNVFTQTDLCTQGKDLNLYDPVFGLRVESPRLGAVDNII